MSGRSFFLLILIVLMASPMFSQHWVTDVSPKPNSYDAWKNPAISIAFNSAINSASLSDSSITISGGVSGRRFASIEYDAAQQTAFLEIGRDFFPGEEVTITVTSKVADLSGNLMPDPFIWRFTIAAYSGSAVFASAVEVAENMGSPTAVDVDADGDLDLVGSKGTTFPDSLLVFVNDGSAAFSRAGAYGIGLVPVAIAAGDLNGDGAQDLIVGHNDGPDFLFIMMNDGFGGFLASDTLQLTYEPWGLGANDVDGDGDLDLTMSGFGAMIFDVFINDGQGGFVQGNTITVGEEAASLVTGDFDGDGDLDGATGNLQSANLSILENDGSGAFSNVNTIAVGNGAWTMVGGDIEGDGDIDLIPVISDASRFEIIRNDNGIFTADTTYLLPAGADVIDGADFDGDRDLDLIFAESPGARIRIYSNDGQGKFAQSAAITAPNSPERICVADFDNDGDMDFVSNSNDALRLYLNETIEPAIFIDGVVIDLGAECIGDTLISQIAVTNLGMETLIVDSISLSSDSVFSALLTFDSLSSLESGSIDVEFRPVAEDLYETEIQVFSNDPRNPLKRILLRGTHNTEPVFTDLPDSIRFEADVSYDINLWDFVEDAESPDNLLTFHIEPADTFLTATYDSSSGELHLMANQDPQTGSFTTWLNIAVFDEAGAGAEDSIFVEILRGLAIDDVTSGKLPETFFIDQNFPNPFNPTTTIRYGLPNAEEVDIRIYNLLGQEVAVLIKERQAAGFYSLQFDSGHLASGIYFYRMKSGQFLETRRMTLLR